MISNDKIFSKRYSGYTITADSTPDYDEWGWDDYWSCTDWINFHKALKAKYGDEKAKELWETAWDKQDFFESNVSWCKYNTTFSNYVKEMQLSGATHMLSDVVAGGSNIVSDVISGSENAAKTLKVIIPLAILGVAAFGGWLLYKKMSNAK